MRVEDLTYQEQIMREAEIPLFTDAPQLYVADDELIEAANNGEIVPEGIALERYFTRLENGDTDYVTEVKNIVDKRAQRFPEATQAAINRRLQFIVPAYRESENMLDFLEAIKEQAAGQAELQWGITLIMDYAIPARYDDEEIELQNMQSQIETFLQENEHLRPYIDTAVYLRRKDTETPVLPVGLARKVGEDVVMYERLQALQEGRVQTETPLYLGLMDMDTGFSPGLLNEMAATIPETPEDTPHVIRVRGSFHREEVRENPHLHPLQLMWEGPISAIGLQTSHNPFNVGRLSAVPARELAMTGGGFAKRLQLFPDEDIRHGLQMRWRLNNVDTVELNGFYSTSARREINVANGIRQMALEGNSHLTMERMRVGAFIKMYGRWAGEMFRGANGSSNGELSDTQLEAAIPANGVEIITNAAYRFTTFVNFAIDELSSNPDAAEVMQLREQFLAGEIPYFEVELRTLEAIRSIAQNDPERFERLKPILASVDQKSRDAVAQILSQNGIEFQLEHTEPIYGILEAQGPIYTIDPENAEVDETVLVAPFHIKDSNQQTAYWNTIRQAVT